MRLIFAALLVCFSVSASAAEFQPFVRGSWQQLIQAHAGRPLVVHFWGVTCVPCLAELPKWGEFVKQHSDLDVVLIAADPFPQETERMSSILDRAGLATVESWTFADKFVDRLRYEVDPRWLGELPRTLLISPDGKVKSYSGIFDLTTIPQWLESQR